MENGTQKLFIELRDAVNSVVSESRQTRSAIGEVKHEVQQIKQALQGPLGKPSEGVVGRVDKLAEQMMKNEHDITTLKENQAWLIKLILGALILGIISAVMAGFGIAP
jgi:hypothetical protein